MSFFKNWEGRKKVVNNEYEKTDFTSMYLPGTEVLTKEGFKPIELLDDGDKILTRYSDTHYIHLFFCMVYG